MLVSRWDAGPLHPGRQRGGCGCCSGGGLIACCCCCCGALLPLLRRVSPVLCNRFCGIVSMRAEVSSCFLAAHMTDLAPLRRGFFCAARCATDCGMVSVGLPGAPRSLPGVRSASPMNDLAPPQRGFFVRVPAQRATNSAAGRWGGGLAAYWRDRQARLWQHTDPPSPAPAAGLLFGDPCATVRKMERACRQPPRCSRRQPLDGRCWPGGHPPPSVGWPRSIRSGRPTRRRGTNRLAEPEPGRRRRESMSS